MGLTFLQASNFGASTIAISLVRYLPVTGNSFSVSIATESQAKSIFRVGGTLSRMYIRINANTISATSTFVVRKATATQNLSISVGSNSSGEFKDLVNSDSVSAGDDMHYMITTGGSGTTITPVTIKVVFDANDYFVSMLGMAGSVTLSTASQTVYRWLSGSTTSDATEANRSHDLNITGEMKYMYLRVDSNARGTSTTFRTRKNAGNGNLSISVGASSSGDFEDTSNTDTISPNDDMCLQTVTGTGTGSLIFTAWHVTALTTTGEFELMNGTSSSQSSATTRFQGISGGGTQTTESNQKSDVMLPCRLTNLVVIVTSNTINSGSATYTAFKTGVAQSLSASVPFGTTGMFEDSSNFADYFRDTDEITTRQQTNGTSGSQAMAGVSVRAIIYTTQKLYAKMQAVNRAGTF